MPFIHPELPFNTSALEPYISAKTLEYHHGKHHKAYVDKANELAKGTPFENMELEKAVLESKKQGGPLFNNIGQIYNHNIFWLSLKPNGGGAPKGTIAGKIDEAFGGFDAFKEKFIATGVGQFGSGWVWLVADKGKVEIVKSHDADTPLTDGKTPLLVCDVWEHAYYLDYQNRRPDFIKTFIDNLVNWEYAEKMLAAGSAQAA